MPADLQFFFRAKEAGVFQHLDAERVQKINDEVGGRDIAVVMCGDCSHSRDKMAHLFQVFRGNEPHVLAFNGGGMMADAMAPANNRGGFNSAPFVQYQILQTLQVKDEIAQIFLEAHFPCAVAGRANMTIVSQIRSLIAAKRIIKERIIKERISGRRLPVKIGLLFHLYNDSVSVEECRRMYYFCDNTMEDFLLQQAPSSV